jgi:hypothetical protein
MSARRRLLPGLRVKEGFLRHPFDEANGVRTSGLVSGRHLAAGHAHDRHNTAYYGVAPSIFRELILRWRDTPPAAPIEGYSFIDFGAGMGRAMLLAAELPFREVVGVDGVRVSRESVRGVSLQPLQRDGAAAAEQADRGGLSRAVRRVGLALCEP